MAIIGNLRSSEYDRNCIVGFGDTKTQNSLLLSKKGDDTRTAAGVFANQLESFPTTTSLQEAGLAEQVWHRVSCSRLRILHEQLCCCQNIAATVVFVDWKNAEVTDRQ
jgi:hypothetical protein